MQDNKHEWEPDQDASQKENKPEHAQVPPSLLFNVLHHLKLSPEQVPTELSLDDSLLKLQSADWEDRVLALRSLEKLKYPISIDLLSPFLHDKDETVRATTVYMLATMSKQIPIHWLVEALHDIHWQVREAAVFAFAKQGSRIPGEALMTALHDKDGSVREAASFVLHQNSIDETSSAFYGHLREVTPMQRELYDSTHLNDKRNTHLPENAPTEDWNGAFMEYSGNSIYAHSVGEQVQAYAAGQYTPHSTTSHETPPDEFAEIMPSRHEKVTSYRLRSKPRKGWWAIIIVTALLFLSLGRLSTMIMPQINFGSDPKNSQSVVVSEKTQGFPSNETNALIMQKTLSANLKLSPQQFMLQLKQRGSIAAIATEQGISATELKAIEMDAFASILNQATKAGDIDSQAASNLWAQLQNNTEFRNKIILNLLNAAPTP